MLKIAVIFAMAILGRSALSLTIPTDPAAAAGHTPVFGAVAVDLDGTLCTSTGDIGERTVQTLRRFVDRGGRVIIATGRGRHHSIGVAKALAERGVHVSDIVASEGGLVLSSPSGGSGATTWDEITFCGMPTGRAVAKILEHMAARTSKVSFAAEVEGEGLLVSDAAYIDAMKRHNRPFFDKFMLGQTSSGGGVNRPRAVPASNFFARLKAAPRVAWVRCVDHSPGGNLETLQDHASEACVAGHTQGPRLKASASTLKLFDCVIGGKIRKAPVAVVIRSADDCKSRGLEAVCRRVNSSATTVTGGKIEPCHFIAFGNASNDVGMLRWAGRSVCPANGQEIAKDAAKEVSVFTNDNDFIADALEKYIAAGCL